MHHLHSSHFQSLDRGHIDLRHVVLSVARVDVLCDGLSLCHNELLTLIDSALITHANTLINAIIRENDFLLFVVLAEPGVHVLGLT